MCLPHIYAAKRLCDGGDNKLGKNRCMSYCCISGDVK